MFKFIVSVLVMGAVAGYMDEHLRIGDRCDRIDLKKAQNAKLRAAQAKA